MAPNVSKLKSICPV